MTEQKSRKQKLQLCEVALYGRCGDLKSNFTRASLFAKNRNADTVCLIIAPSADDSELRFTIVQNYIPNSVVNAQGVILSQSGQATVVESRDCPTVVIEHLKTGNVGVLHCGREQLANRHNPCMPTGVIERLIPELGPLDGEMLNVYITGGISAQHFEHKDPAYIKPFLRFNRPELIRDQSKLTLDLVAAISVILSNFGVPKSNIKHDGLCTYETPWLGSRRAKKEGANWTLVVKR